MNHPPTALVGFRSNNLQFTYAKRKGQNGTKLVKQIEFKGERLDMTSVRRLQEKS